MASLGIANRLMGGRFMEGLSACAQTSDNSDFKALIVYFQYGGNDTNNTIVPLDSTRYAQYAAARGALALPQAALLPLGSTSYGIHPSMPNTAQLFAAGNAAVIANIGPLAQPTTVAQAKQMLVPLPTCLCSHGDQQREQQTFQVGEQTLGAGGLIADSLQGLGPSNLPMVISLTGSDDVFINGQNTVGFVAPTSGSSYACGAYTACDAATNMAHALLTIQYGGAIVSASQQNKAVTDQDIAIYQSELAAAMPLTTKFPNSTCKQLIQTIQVQKSLGTKRLILFWSGGGFDTHSSQLGLHGNLLASMDSTILAIASGLEEAGLFDQVIFTMLSEFNRTLVANASLGSDHAWGTHQLVIGGPVKGGQVYGTFPTPVLGGPNDWGRSGIWVPTTPSVQFAADLATWFGVSASQLATAFPVLSNFPNTPIGFV
jgi:uncharacterized protein (DUF1501 family)